MGWVNYFALARVKSPVVISTAGFVAV